MSSQDWLKEVEKLAAIQKVFAQSGIDIRCKHHAPCQNDNVMEANTKDHPYKIGKNYLIRTVTMCLVGKLEWVGEKELVLSQASWVADTGRFSSALANGLETEDNSEIKRFIDDVVVGRGALVDACIYQHELPTQNK